MTRVMATAVVSVLASAAVTLWINGGGITAQAQQPAERKPSVMTVDSLYYSIARPAKGISVVLTNSVLFRVPNLPDTGWTEHYDQLHDWLAREYGGYARWSAEIDPGRNAAGVEYYFYLVSMGADNNPDLAELVDQKMRKLFPDFPVYVVSIPHMPLMNSPQ